jgi:hypothetical protein
LNENVSNLRKQIEFYQKLRNFKQSNSTSSPHENVNSSLVQSDLNSIDLENIKNDIRKEFEEFNKQQLDEYEDYLAEECMLELDSLETEYNEQADRIDEESNAILNDLEKLNKESEKNLVEYEHLRSENDRLNERLITLSTSLCSFNNMPKEQQDVLITNFSNLNLKRLIQTRTEEIKELKSEIASVKNNYIKYFDDQGSMLQLKTKKQSSDTNQSNKRATSNGIPSEQISLNAKLRSPYYADIEYTKSNLFAYFVIKFDLLNSMNSINLTSKMTSNVNVNCFLKIVNDSIDGHSIMIENSHKILDFDLSEWTIRREIHNAINPDFIKKNKLNLECTNVKINTVNSNGEWKSVKDLNDENSAACAHSVEVIQYKFPKNFKLKRRKKINLIASGASGMNNNNSTNLNRAKTKSSLSCNSLSEINSSSSRSKSNKRSKLTGSSTSLTGISAYTGPSQITKSKCACCACKIMLTQKKGDIDSLEIKEVSTWGSGLLVITKFINNKNVSKLIDIKCLKNIWVNSKQKELSLDNLI